MVNNYQYPLVLVLCQIPVRNLHHDFLRKLDKVFLIRILTEYTKEDSFEQDINASSCNASKIIQSKWSDARSPQKKSTATDRRAHRQDW